MENKFGFTMWTYPSVRELSVDEVDTWADCGFNYPMSPETSNEEDLIPYLDRAQERGIKIIANLGCVSYWAYKPDHEQDFIDRFKKVLDVIGNHPALYGFIIGDEPSNKGSLDNTKAVIRIVKKYAPHLEPIINYQGALYCYNPDRFDGGNCVDWLKSVVEETGCTEFCFDEYSQAVNDAGGKTIYLNTVKEMVAAAKESGNKDVWGCLLSSGHHVFSPQQEVDFRWQISTAAALGLHGIMWFRLYDRDFANECYGSPIDEFGNKTEAYYGLLRSQRRFLNHYGEIIMKLNLEKTYSVTLDRGLFPMFGPGEHDLIKDIKGNDEVLVSFFTHENGDEYMALVSSERKWYGAARLCYDRSKCDLYKVTMNGERLESLFESGDLEYGDDYVEFIMLPASFNLFKIVRK